MEILDTAMKVSHSCPAEFKFPRLLCIILMQEDGYKYCTCNCHPGSTRISKNRLGTWCTTSLPISSSYFPLSKYHSNIRFSYKQLLWLPLESCAISFDKKYLKDTDHSDTKKGWKPSRSAPSQGQDCISVYRIRVSPLKQQNTEK